MKTALEILSKELKSIGIPYEFMRWTSPVNGEYWVGEYTEETPTTEDGLEQCVLMLTGTTRGQWMDLETSKEKIKHHFPTIHGLRVPTENGAVVFFYEDGFPVPTGEADLKRIQVNLRIKQWKGLN